MPGTPKNSIGHHRAACTLVCIAAVLTIARKGNPSRLLSADRWVRTTWHIYTMERQAVEKKSEITKFAGKWMGRQGAPDTDKSHAVLWM